jgi:regulatory protein
MNAALAFLAHKARTVREMETHLDEQYGEYEVQQVVERLRELNYLNDEAYAAEFIRTRLNTKPVSRNKLRIQLAQHLLPNDVIEEAVSAISDGRERENASAMAAKLHAQLIGRSPDETRKRLYQRLISRGFSHEDTAWATDAAINDAGTIQKEPYA